MAGAASTSMEECQICMEDKPAFDIQPLLHAGGIAGGKDKGASAAEAPLSRSKSGRDVSSHKACSDCRQALLQANQPCPWCRDEVVWNQVFGFLDTLKGDVTKAANPDQLADLMAQWEMYEMTRSNSDVLLFARDMIQDRSLKKHLDNAIQGNASWLRDSIGLWCRFYGMVVDDRLSLSDSTAAERLRLAVEAGVACFESNGGNAPEHGGAAYTQICVALLCAKNNQMGTKTLVHLAQRIGQACVRFWHEKSKHTGVRSRLPKAYCQGVSEMVWGEQTSDPMLMTFYTPASVTAENRAAMLKVITEQKQNIQNIAEQKEDTAAGNNTGGKSRKKCIIM